MATTKTPVNSALTTLGALLNLPTAELGAYFAGLNLTQTRTMCDAVKAAAGICSKGDRHAMAAALSIAIINAGARADACREGTRTHATHIARMNLLDAADTACILPDCAPEYRVVA